ncbi:MAG: MBL fold metallo-hydrolase [Sinobacteraceae bacterium]|nr:MBL fold metallo-hydrolase [Nevskiaceae bacterium]
MGTGLQLQVLGSGGPEVQDKRAGSSYLIWQNGRARVLIDAGGGAALRFGESGAQMEDLHFILLSHLHLDHTADLPALFMSSYFGQRTRPLPLFGPAGNGQFPATTVFIADLFDPARGAYRYLGSYLSGHDDGYSVQPHNVQLAANEIRQVATTEGIGISAATVIHGSVPALAWRVDLEHRSAVFSGDGNGDNGNLQKLADGADLLVIHNAIPEGTDGPPRALHMPPSVIGVIAKAAHAHRLVLSHRMLRTLGREAETLSFIRRNYTGPVAFANDLDCIPLGPAEE